jgi:N-acetylmuramoyl-L-alanine amidase
VASPDRRLLLAALALSVMGAAGPPAAERPAPPERAELHGRSGLFLEIVPQPGDSWDVIASHYLARPADLAPLRGARSGAAPHPGRVVSIPYAALSDEYKMMVVRDLFPSDGPRGGDWAHRIGGGRLDPSDESLWNIALWFTGDADNFTAIADRNDLADLATRKGQEIIIPGRLLLPPFARAATLGPAAIAAPAAAPAPAAAISPADRGSGLPALEDDFTEAEPEGTPEEAPPSLPAPSAEGAESLTYGVDAEGPHAIYHLKRGEAIYSAVVVRFTGRVDVQDVNDLAFAIARRSAVTDVTNIPVGFPLKIPVDALLPEYLPPDDPRRQAWERSQADIQRYTNPATSRNLRGVAVILDAGHGGADRGAAHNGLWEHDYVYDILCRVKQRLERDTGAQVLPIIKDSREGYAVHDTATLRRNQAEILLTDPPFPLGRQYVSVNLRWYLTNSIYRRLVAAGHDPLKIVFTSIHADARHPALGGAMIYVPGEEYRRRRYGYNGAVYTRYREVREQPYVSFSRAERERSEGLSLQFAARLVQAFRSLGVAVHPYRPVRERIIRRGRAWVPAVLRCNAVPVETLLEVSNLSNPADSRLLAEPAYRQKIADAYVAALQRYYAEPAPTRPAGRGGH